MGIDQLSPSKRETHRALHFAMATRRKDGDPFRKYVPRDGTEIVAVGHTGFGQAFPRSQRNLHRYAAYDGRNFRGDEFVQVSVGIIPTQQQHWAAARRFWQFGPPDLVLSHGLYSSQFDQSSPSVAESGR